MKLYDKAEKALREKYDVDLLKEIFLAREDRAVYYVEYTKNGIFFNKVHGKSPMDYFNDQDSFEFSDIESIFYMHSKYGEVAGKQFYKNRNLNTIKNMVEEANVTIPLYIENQIFWVRFHLYRTLKHEDGSTKLASCYITDVSKYLIHEEALYEKTHKDELTMLFNRYALYYHFELHGGRTPITSFYFDIDNFKKYNDKYGHDIGDEVLIRFSRQLKEMSSDDFNCYRLGGDEFYCLLFDNDPEKGKQIVTQLSESIRNIKVPGVSEQLSISIGVLHTNEMISHKREAFMKEGDRLMYTSKRNGKNQATYGEFLVYS